MQISDSSYKYTNLEDTDFSPYRPTLLFTIDVMLLSK